MINFLKRYIGTKKFYQELLIVALPIALHQLLSALINFLDSAMIGQWGLEKIGSSEILTSAVMIANRYFSSFQFIAIMLAITCTIFISQYLGAKRRDKIRQVFGFSLILVGILSLIVFAFGAIYSREIITFFATTFADGQAMIDYGSQYLFIISFTFIPMAFSIPIGFALRAVKRTTVPLVATGISAVSNVLLNILFIYTLDMGIVGAAVATLIARFIELGIMLFHYFKVKPEFYGSFKQLFSIDFTLAKNVLVKGFPMLLAQVITEGINVFMFFAYARIEAGNAGNIAAINLSVRIVDIVVALVGGMGSAASILVGMRLGAGKVEEAKTNARWQIGYITFFSFFSTVAMIALIPLVIRVYQFEATTSSLLTTIMIIHALSLPFVFYSSNVIFITRTGGYTKAPLWITNAPYLLLKIPFVVLFVFISRSLFDQATGLHSLMEAIGLTGSLVVFIFLIDRLIELVRAAIALWIYHHAIWWNNLEIGDEDEVLFVEEVA